MPFGVHDLIEGERRSKGGQGRLLLSISFLEHISKTAQQILPILHTYDIHMTYMCLLVCVRICEGQPKVKRRSKKAVTCHTFRFRSISRKPLNGLQPYYTHMIPTCPRCAFWGVRPSWRSKEGQRRLRLGISFPEHISKTAKRITTILHTHDPHMPSMCRLGCMTFLKANEGQKKVKTWHFVSGAYLENR